MLTDAFPRETQGRAFSTYNLGISIGSGVALLVGGLVAAAVYAPGKTFDLPLLGEVRAWQGAGNDLKVTMRFPAVGVKTILARFLTKP